VRRRGGRGRRRGQLGGPGSGVLGGAHAQGIPAHKGRRPWQQHVEVSCRPDHGRRERRAAREHRGPRPHGRETPRRVVAENNRSGARRTLGARTLFVFIGAEANTGWLQGAVELDERGFILTGRALDHSALEEDTWRGLSREPYPLETSLPGVFAAGDVRSGSIKRVASAVGEGSMAVRLVHQYLADTGV
jgi:NADPH-dependent glutamate synthase beta subunit-like oxidoreductase